MRLNENGSKKESISENPEPEAKRNVQATWLWLIAPPCGSMYKQRNSKVRIHSRWEKLQNLANNSL